jgi:hypothetical protein
MKTAAEEAIRDKNNPGKKKWTGRQPVHFFLLSDAL